MIKNAKTGQRTRLHEFRFDDYTAAELRTCGKLLVKAMDQVAIDDSNTEGWTEFVLDWFADAAPDGMLVDARPPRRDRGWSSPRDTHGEFLVDLTHSDYPQYTLAGGTGYWSEKYWKKALNQSCKVRLALESEWGKKGNAKATRVAVLQDAIKVAALRADAKVVVFGPETKRERAQLVRDLRKLRTKSEDDKPWLLVALPWSEKGAWSKVLSGRPPTAIRKRVSRPTRTSARAGRHAT